MKFPPEPRRKGKAALVCIRGPCGRIAPCLPPPPEEMRTLTSSIPFCFLTRLSALSTLFSFHRGRYLTLARIRARACTCIEGRFWRHEVQKDVWHDVSRPAWNERLSTRIDGSLPFLSESERRLYLVPHSAMITRVFMTHDPWRAAISQHAVQRPPPARRHV